MAEVSPSEPRTIIIRSKKKEKEDTSFLQHPTSPSSSVRKWVLVCDSEEEREIWARVVQNACDKIMTSTYYPEIDLNSEIQIPAPQFPQPIPKLLLR